MGGRRKLYSRHRLIAALVVAYALVGISGCTLLLVGGGAAAGVIGTKYVMGKLEAEVEAPVSKVQGASAAGLESLGLRIDKNQGDAFSAQLESKTADDKKISIYVESVAESRSKITIRVGLLGDEDRSRKIFDAIKARL